MTVDNIKVEVAYAKPEKQIILKIELPIGSSAYTAISVSGLLPCFPEIDLTSNQIGIFGKPCSLDQVLRDGDRVEIYRPLIADPKEARRHRAADKGGKHRFSG
jgi:putative ubiquitin-RnfH superfamily antitoxin RatB of RatAB toxin-antitoxin module